MEIPFVGAMVTGVLIVAQQSRADLLATGFSATIEKSPFDTAGYRVGDVITGWFGFNEGISQFGGFSIGTVEFIQTIQARIDGFPPHQIDSIPTPVIYPIHSIPEIGPTLPLLADSFGAIAMAQVRCRD